MSKGRIRIFARLSVIALFATLFVSFRYLVKEFGSNSRLVDENVADTLLLGHFNRELKWMQDYHEPVASQLGNTKDVECRTFHSMPNVTDVCAFVKNTSDCHIDEGFISYTKFVYCTLPSLVPLAVFVLLIWWLFLFVGLAVTADDFFCPSLTVIAHTLRLSHNIAGVTFLAFGNGAPDIFSAIAAIGSAKNGNAGLAVGALFGAGVFVTTIVAGVIAILCPFDAMQRPFLRDVIFYLGAVYWAFYILWKKEITKFEALGFIGLYLVYVIVVVVGRYIYQRNRQKESEISITVEPPKKSDLESDSEDEGFGISSLRTQRALRNKNKDPHNVQDRVLDDSVSMTFDQERAALSRETFNIQARLLDPSVTVQYDEATEKSGLLENGVVENYTSPKKSEEDDDASSLKHFLDAVNPIDTENWAEKRFYAKIYEIFKCPMVFALKLTIPIVDFEAGENHNWNRHLNSLHCFTGPVFGVIVTKVGFTYLGGVFPVYGLVIILGAVLAAIVFFLTTNDTKPRFHSVYAYLGFAVGVIWIYSIANEIVNILQTFGVVFNISNAILGLTFLAWGNSIGDLIADSALARQGYPRMGISACFGGPLFNMLMGIGIPFTIGTFKNGGTYKLQLTLVELILAGFLMFSLVSSLIIVPLSKFRMSRPYGIFLFCLYGVFIVVAMLAETHVIYAKV